MKKLLVLFSMVVAVAACKKEESPDAGNSNWQKGDSFFPGPKAEVIIAKKWKLTNHQVDYSNGLPSETFSNVPDCQKDNLLQFKSDKKYNVDEVTDVCPGNQPMTTYDWNTLNNEQKVRLNSMEWEIIQLDNTTMKLKNTNASASLTVTTVDTYTAQ